MYKLMGRVAEAEPLYRQCMETRQRVLGSKHPRTLASMHNVGAILQSLGRFAEAGTVYTECVKASKASLGAQHPDTKKYKKLMRRALKQVEKEGKEAKTDK